jgi:acyl carrier protein
VSPQRTGSPPTWQAGPHAASAEALTAVAVAARMRLEPDGVRLEQTLGAELGMTPLDLVAVAQDLEDAHGVVLPVERLHDVKTVADLARLLAEARERAPSFSGAA